MSARPRIDLDGVPLSNVDDASQVVAVFRHRTHQGLILLVPESTDELIRWDDVRACNIDLHNGSIRLELSEAVVARENWLRGAHVLVGSCFDRVELQASRFGFDD